jgi:hypothetical protein
MALILMPLHFNTSAEEIRLVNDAHHRRAHEMPFSMRVRQDAIGTCFGILSSPKSIFSAFVHETQI